MKCPKCGAENPENLKFCGYCGANMRTGRGRPEEDDRGNDRSKEIKITHVPIEQPGVTIVQVPRDEGRVTYIITPVRQSALKAKEVAGEVGINLLQVFGVHGKYKDLSTSETFYETRELYEGPAPTKDDRHKYLEKVSDILSLETHSDVSPQEFLVTSSSPIVDEHVNLTDYVSVSFVGKKADSPRETKK